MKKLNLLKIFTVFVTLSVFLSVFSFSAEAQKEPEHKKIDFGVDSLTLDVGETYKFQMNVDENDQGLRILNWYSSNDSIISIDPRKTSVTALAPGKTGILVESLDKRASAICHVTVRGSETQDEQEEKSGSKMLSETDRKKITSLSINRYLSFVGEWSINAKNENNASQRIFNVAADVVPGTEVQEANYAQSLGMIDATPLPNLNVVTLNATLDQILNFVDGNENIVEIFELEPKFIIEPVSVDSPTDSNQKSVGLGGNTEELTSVSTAHNLGFNGSGAILSIIDTGLNSSHEQFAGRVIREKCFSSQFTDGNVTCRSVCSGNALSADTADPSGAQITSNFFHGSHTTGIMAGRDGIAPQAKIVAVQGFTEIIGPCSRDSSQTCYDSVMVTSDELKAYDYLIGLVKSGLEITALNMSYGNGGDTQYDPLWGSYCDNYDSYGYSEEYFGYLRSVKKYIRKLIDAGIMPVVASGNNHSDGAVCAPSCFSGVISVGALSNNSSSKVAYFSNHAEILTITAPGSNICSAAYPTGYGSYSGTSMATPMVTGAMALVKQAYPYNTITDYKHFLVNITPKTVNQREYVDTVYTYTKPVLNFSKLNQHVMAPLTVDASLVCGYDHEIIIPVLSDSRADGYKVSVYNSSDGSEIKPNTEVITSGNWTYIKLSHNNLVNGNSYRISVTRYHTLGNIQYMSNTVNTVATPGSSGTFPSGLKMGGTLNLPQSLRVISDSAFEGSRSFWEVNIPEGVQTIGSRAFANCGGFLVVHVPDNVSSIASNAFDGNADVVLSCKSDNFGASYARANNIRYRIEP